MHKPNQQTVLPFSRVPELLADLPLSRLRGLGGEKVGGALAKEFGAESVGQLRKIPENALVDRCVRVCVCACVCACARVYTRVHEAVNAPMLLWVNGNTYPRMRLCTYAKSRHNAYVCVCTYVHTHRYIQTFLFKVR
jgi:hypothetical protein